MSAAASVVSEASDGGAGTALVLTVPDRRLPRVAWWGPVGAGLPAAQVASAVRPDGHVSGGHGYADRSVSVLPEPSESWLGRPGLAGHRVGGLPAVGRDWSTAFVPTGDVAADGDGALDLHAIDTTAGLSLRTQIEPLPGGGLRVRHTLTNDAEGDYVVDALDVTVPVPDRVREVLDLTGRWGRERSPQRAPIRDGMWLRDGRTGKTGPESPTVLVAGTTGFGFRRGEVWGVHVAWSGNCRYALERQDSGVVTMIGGETLLPGEIVLARGESYATPWVHLGAAGDGLDTLAAQFHGYLRALPAHPRAPRPVNLNVWEAVYFDHDLGRLRQLADQAAAMGVERYVLDDGWFGARRDDTAGLGDWTVSPDVWPEGLDPLIEHVHGLGMQFGLWFEPEMVNPDSELYRAHPDWILATGEREPQLQRHQQVLDLGRDEVREYVFDAVHAILERYRVDYVKWDHNRFLADAGSAARSGAPGVHGATLGFYRLLDDLRAAHPGVEWETCSSGGGRIDLAVLERTERVWTSDMTDALSRQLIQRWTCQLVAPEYLGAHVSAPYSHQTGRYMSLDFRAATAFFGDFGIEWDITSADDGQRAQLARWIETYRAHRDLLHGGRVVRADTDSDVCWIHGVVSADRSSAVFAYVLLDEQVNDSTAFVLPGLDAARTYRVHRIDPSLPAIAGAPAWPSDGIEASGAVLGSVGLLPPARVPLSAMIVHVEAV